MSGAERSGTTSRSLAEMPFGHRATQRCDRGPFGWSHIISPPARVLWFLAGFGIALTLVLAVAEWHLRLWPTRDLLAYLGDKSPLTGPFVPHPVWGYTYRNYEAFREIYKTELDAFGSLAGDSDSRPTWALFGNSFVQAPGMLGDTAAQALPGHRIFYLKRNERLELRFAQMSLLLEHGLKVERVVLALLPIDCLELGRMPLRTFYITPKGALTFTPSPPPLPTISNRSRLAMAAWVRTGRHAAYPGFHGDDLYRQIDPELKADLRRLFRGVAGVARRKQVHVTALLIPPWDIVVADRPAVFAEVVGTLVHDEGLDVLDPRRAFRAAPDRARLYARDKHLSERGNQLLLDQLLRHLDVRRSAVAS